MIEDSIASGILLLEAEAEIDRLKHQLQEARAEVKRLMELTTPRWDDARKARPEPSRLEIAAMAMQGMLTSNHFDRLRISKSALEYTDALIAAAKEGK